MLIGLDLLIEKKTHLLKDKKVGLAVNPTSLGKNFAHAVSLLKETCNLTTLLGPEHGIWGNAQDMETVKISTDPLSGLPVLSLYGNDEASLSPTTEMLDNIDTLVFDMQDIGSRYYTFTYTMALLMRACRLFGKEMIICDRPNPIGGIHVEGNTVKEKYRSFVGMYPLANRHGMTLGEMALFFNQEFGINCPIEIIKMVGWKRHQEYDQTGLAWIMPSPNMPTLDTALVYPGMCFLEGTNISEGRGTTRPFEYFGAPFISPHSFADDLNNLDLPGIFFRGIFFKPTFHKWAGKTCGGAQLHITDRNIFKPVITGLAVIKAIRDAYPTNFLWRTEKYEFRDDVLAFDLLAGGRETRKMLEDGTGIEEIENMWKKEKNCFMQKRKNYLLYS